MELERNLPQTLVEQLNNDAHIEVFEAWRESRGAAYSRELTTTSLRYDKQRSELIPGRGQQATQSAVNRYLAEDPIGVNPGSCTWADVLDKMKTAKEEWESKSKFRLRHGAGIERNILPLLEAIPTDNGLGLLKGALALIFHAVKRRSDACERIFTCFSEIPEMIAKGHTLARIHPGKLEVASRVDELHKALFDSIPSLIDILLRRDRAPDGPSEQRRRLQRAKGKVIGVVKDLLRDAVKEVDDLIRPVKAAISKLEDCATMLNNEKTEMIYELVAGLQVDVQNIHDIIKPKSTELSLRDRHSDKLDNLERKMDALYLLQDRVLDDVLTFSNGLFRFANEVIRRRQLEGGPSAPDQGANRAALDDRRLEFPSFQRQLERPQPAGERLHNVDIDHLLEAIGTDDEHLAVHADTDRLARMQSVFPPKALKNAYHVMESDELVTWISSLESELMVVDGGCLDQSKGMVSPMTVLCASVAVGLTAHTASADPGIEPSDGVVLFFACGEHTSPSGLLAGPRGMMRSLISQLLITRGLPWNPRRDRKGRVRYERHPDLSFLAESNTLWPEILKHSRAGSGVYFAADVSNGHEKSWSRGHDKEPHTDRDVNSKTRGGKPDSEASVPRSFQVPTLGRDKKCRRNDASEDSLSDSDSDSDSDYDYASGGYKSPFKDPAPTTAEQAHLHALVDVFTELVRQLDPGITVYCIVDGVSYYETAQSEWRPQINQVVYRLADDLWRGGGGYRAGPRFKLLMTSPGRSQGLLDLVRRRYGIHGALCVDMVARISPLRTRGEYLGIQHLGVPARARSNSNRRDRHRDHDQGRGLWDEERHYSDDDRHYGGGSRQGREYSRARRLYGPRAPAIVIN